MEEITTILEQVSLKEGCRHMINNDIFHSDPSYALCSKLAEYLEMLEENYPKSDICLIEEELRDLIADSCDSLSEQFEEIVDLVHRNKDEEYLDFDEIDDWDMNGERIDFDEVDDLVSALSASIRYQFDCRDSWQSTYSQSDELVEARIAHAIELKSLADRLELDLEDIDRSRLIRMKASQIYQAIVASEIPISKELLTSMIPGFTDRALAMAVSRKDILNYRGLYYFAGHIRFSTAERKQVCTYLNGVLSNQDEIHADDLYPLFEDHFPELVSRAYIQSGYQLFSFIELFFPNQFSLSRPFIAAYGVHIRTPQEHLRSYISGRNEISISEFVAFAHEKYIKVNSILDLIVSLNDKVILKDRETLIPIESTGIDNQAATQVCNLIREELNSTPCLAIRDLSCIPYFPRINIPWDEWLIYSVIRKWAEGICVHTTSSHFRRSIPVVALPAAATEEKIAEIAARCSDLSYKPKSQMIQDLDELDDLILIYEDDDFDFDFDGDDDD